MPVGRSAALRHERSNRTDAIELVEAQHRQHAVLELAIRDLKDQALAHFPSGTFLANAVWTVIAARAHNLLRWTTLIGLPDMGRARRVRRRPLAQLAYRVPRRQRGVLENEASRAVERRSSRARLLACR